MNLMIIDNHNLFLESLAAALRQQESVERVFAYKPTAEKEILSCLANEEVALLLLDINLDGQDGFSVARMIQKTIPDQKIAFLTGHGNQIHLRERASAFGADGFFTKDPTPKELIELIHQAIAGKKPGLDLDGLLSPRLTEREMEVAQLLCKGYTNKQLAEALLISERQIERVKQQLKRKFQVKNDKEIIRRAIELGYELIE